MNLRETSPYISLYVHVPFCNLKCDYCAFYSIGHHTEEQHAAYLARMERDFQDNAGQCAPLRSIFMGGGTPSALAPDELRRLVTAIRRHFSLAPDCEWSCEANPDSLTPEKVAILAEAGVNRISLGIQSFIPEERAAIGRRGSLDTLPDVIAAIRKSDIPSINFDLMFMLPKQTPDSYAQSLKQALAFEPQHLSAYALILEPKTPLARRMPQTNDEDFLKYWNLTDDITQEKGLQRYEISNFAQPGFKCRHNNDVWHGVTYLGCGPAATSFNGKDRFTQPNSLSQWLNGVPPEVDSIPPEQRATEILAFGMRTVEGWDLEQFRKTTDYDALSLRGKELEYLHSQKLIRLNNSYIAPTPQGLIYNDTILETLI